MAAYDKPQLSNILGAFSTLHLYVSINLIFFRTALISAMAHQCLPRPCAEYCEVEMFKHLKGDMT